jgi:O-antigen ligase
MSINLIKQNNKFFLYLIGLLPLSLLPGTLIPELFILLILSSFLYEVLKNKDFSYFNKRIFFFLLIIYGYLIFNFSVSSDKDLSFLRAFAFIRFPLLVLSIDYFLKKNDYKLDIVFSLWAITLVIVIFDLFFQSYFGYNLFGFESHWNNRLSGFMNDELKIAHWLIGFTMPTIAFFSMKNKNLFYTLITSIVFLTILLLVNERSNALKGIFILFFIVIFNTRLSFKKKFTTIILSLTIITTLISFNENIKQRFYLEIQQMTSTGGALGKKFTDGYAGGIHFEDQLESNISIIDYVKISNYGPHFYAAIDIFKKNKLFGTGLKTFRIECANASVEPEMENRKCNTHPHQIYLEILSETGIIGFLLFFSFFLKIIFKSIKVYLKSNDLILLSLCGFVISQILPFLPSGSFFTSFSAIIFWINISLIYSLVNKYK